MGIPVTQTGVSGALSQAAKARSYLDRRIFRRASASEVPPQFKLEVQDFDFDRVAAFGNDDVERLLSDESIVRRRGKIQAVINSARRAIELVQAERSLAAYIWRLEPKTQDLAMPQTASTSAASAALSKDLKRRGWTFVGPTTVYAFMQAMGLVDDHLEGCAIRPAAEAARR